MGMSLRSLLWKFVINNLMKYDNKIIILYYIVGFHPSNKMTINLLLLLLIMLQQRVPLNNLFTFGFGQLQQQLKQQKINKFPFLHNVKMKKTPLLHKMVSQQRQKNLLSNENNNFMNQPQLLKSRGRALSQGTKRSPSSIQKQAEICNSKRTSSVQNKHRKKISLPKVLKNVFPGLNNVVSVQIKRQITSAEPSHRYLGMQESLQLVQPFNALQQQKYQSGMGNLRPRSVMLLSQLNCQFPQQKIRTIQHHRNRLYAKGYKSKTDQKFRSGMVNNKIIENINELKKIYC